jgi:hypothetical protein
MPVIAGVERRGNTASVGRGTSQVEEVTTDECLQGCRDHRDQQRVVGGRRPHRREPRLASPPVSSASRRSSNRTWISMSPGRSPSARSSAFRSSMRTRPSRRSCGVATN